MGPPGLSLFDPSHGIPAAGSCDQAGPEVVVFPAGPLATMTASCSQRRPREGLLSESRTGDEVMTRMTQMQKHRTSFMADELGIVILYR